MDAQGTVVWYKAHLGFGFIKVNSHRFPDAFVHYSEIQSGEEKAKLKKGQRVKFKLFMTRLGTVAKEVRYA